MRAKMVYESEVTDNFDLILSNLRKDNPKFKGYALKANDDIFIPNVKFTSKVWGQYDAPVNKMFDRSEPRDLDIRKGDEFVVITGISPTNNLNIYVNYRPDKWYWFQNNLDALLDNSDIIE